MEGFVGVQYTGYGNRMTIEKLKLSNCIRIILYNTTD